MPTRQLITSPSATRNFRQGYLAEPRLDTVLSAVAELEVRDDEVLLVLTGDKAPLNAADLAKALGETKRRFSGGQFPGVLFGRQRSDQGTLLMTVPSRLGTYTVRGLGSDDFCLDHLPTIQDLPRSTTVTAWVVVDGFSRHTGSFLEALYDRYGNSVGYLGGGAGSLTQGPAPSLLTQEGHLGEAASITFIDRGMTLGVRHGWKRLAGPFVANRTDGNTIQSLNWSNPFEVYRAAVEEDLGQEVTTDNFFSIAKAYPFGMVRAVDDPVIRDPISVTPSGELVCVGDVRPNSNLNLMTGTPDDLIRAAEEAAAGAAEGIDSAEACLVADCISRVIFLEEDFDRELDAITRVVESKLTDTQVAGALTLGEISSYGDAYLELFNKTIVVGLM